MLLESLSSGLPGFFLRVGCGPATPGPAVPYFNSLRKFHQVGQIRSNLIHFKQVTWISENFQQKWLSQISKSLKLFDGISFCFLFLYLLFSGLIPLSELHVKMAPSPSSFSNVVKWKEVMFIVSLVCGLALDLVRGGFVSKRGNFQKRPSLNKPCQPSFTHSNVQEVDIRKST